MCCFTFALNVLVFLSFAIFLSFFVVFFFFFLLLLRRHSYSSFIVVSSLSLLSSASISSAFLSLFLSLPILSGKGKTAHQSHPTISFDYVLRQQLENLVLSGPPYVFSSHHSNKSSLQFLENHPTIEKASPPLKIDSCYL